MAGISNDASLRGKVCTVAKKNGLRAQEVLQMYLFEHLLLRLDWSSIGTLAHGAAERRGSRGIPAADPGRLPAGDSPGRVPSTWQETAVPSRAAQGCGRRTRRPTSATRPRRAPRTRDASRRTWGTRPAPRPPCRARRAPARAEAL